MIRTWMWNRKRKKEIKTETRKALLIIDDDADITNSFNLALEDSGLFVIGTYNDV